MFPISIVAKCKQYAGSLPRRDLFRGGSFLALPSLLSRQTNAAPVPSTGGLGVDRTSTNPSEFVRSFAGPAH